MSDGRDIMKKTYKIIKEISGEFDSKKEDFSDEKFESTKKSWKKH